jgi:hypothetical protein
MSIAIVPIAESHAEGFHACLDIVAREEKYLAQVQALPLERIQGFVRESVATDAVQFVAIDGPLVVGWCDIFPAWAHAVQHCGSVGMGLLPAYREAEALGSNSCLPALRRHSARASRVLSSRPARTMSVRSGCTSAWGSSEKHSNALACASTGCTTTQFK